jgi:hypothetical protein
VAGWIVDGLEKLMGRYLWYFGGIGMDVSMSKVKKGRVEELLLK